MRHSTDKIDKNARAECYKIGAKYAEPREPRTYNRICTITEADDELDIVTAEDSAGNLWSFYSASEWIKGDICALEMGDSGTPENILDDVIISARHCRT